MLSMGPISPKPYASKDSFLQANLQFPPLISFRHLFFFQKKEYTSGSARLDVVSRFSYITLSSFRLWGYMCIQFCPLTPSIFIFNLLIFFKIFVMVIN